jgi:hypothetical protein
MKQIILCSVAVLLCISAVTAQNPKTKDNPVGKWKFEAPFAPEGFTTGIIEVNIAENKYSTAISFPFSDYKILGENVRVENDNLAFNVYIEGGDISITLKMESPVKMTGKAVHAEGEIPLTLTREMVKNQ